MELIKNELLIFKKIFAVFTLLASVQEFINTELINDMVIYSHV